MNFELVLTIRLSSAILCELVLIKRLSSAEGHADKHIILHTELELFYRGIVML